MSDSAERKSLLLIDEGEVLRRVLLNVTDAARLCGITSRQLNYWTAKGFVNATQDRPRRYTVDGLTRARLIKQYLDEGYSLDRAVRLLTEIAPQPEEERTAERVRARLAEDLETLESDLLEVRRHVPVDLLLRRLSTRYQRLASAVVRDRLAADDSDAVRARQAIERAMEALDEALSVAGSS